MDDNPSLKASSADYIANAYIKAVLKAADETKLDESVFPETCGWTMQQILDDSFLP